MKNKFVTLLASVGMCASLGAQTWIWYPGDYEIWLGNQMNNRRTERGAFFLLSGKRIVIMSLLNSVKKSICLKLKRYS